MSQTATCPDCDVEMLRSEPVTSMEGDRLTLVTDRSRSEAVGVVSMLAVEAYVCPRCHLVRWYADRT
ncbi:hypothetical protein [Halomarina ordinaria]|uniref:Small CPxCG-related zinc finger protein n=1 Tax=Halomarina ordinaria TaxID=3033939 RepID=A0ABD5U8A9_9EURY|nr:hypothetical protein [Halomarina sp. PSRA2]